MRDRLIELLNVAVGDSNLTDNEVKIVADYLLENGVIVPPCKVGDVLCTIENCVNRPERIVVTAIHLHGKHRISISALSRSRREYVYTTEDFGKYVFLTKEDAEQALKGGA